MSWGLPSVYSQRRRRTTSSATSLCRRLYTSNFDVMIRRIDFADRRRRPVATSKRRRILTPRCLIATSIWRRHPTSNRRRTATSNRRRTATSSRRRIVASRGDVYTTVWRRTLRLHLLDVLRVDNRKAPWRRSSTLSTTSYRRRVQESVQTTPNPRPWRGARGKGPIGSERPNIGVKGPHTSKRVPCRAHMEVKGPEKS